MRFATRYRHQISAEFLDILANLGISMRGREGIVRLMIDFNRLQLDTYEQGLMSAICATSADRGVKDKFDYAVLSATQVISCCAIFLGGISRGLLSSVIENVTSG